MHGAITELHNPIHGVLVALAQAFNYDPTVATKDEPMELDKDGNADKKKFAERFSPTSNYLLILGVLTKQSDAKLPIAQDIFKKSSYEINTLRPGPR